MRDTDASSIIYGWDNYPIEQFPKLWDWIGAQIADGELAISRVAFDEVETVSPECAGWLRDQDITRKDVTNETANKALSIKNELGIQNDNYHSEGVGENDIFIISTAKVSNVELISDENRQATLPDNQRRYKIPAVCAMPSVSVTCINFVEYIKQSNQVFG